jgi:apolipoprotein N-acyltransferase
MKVCAATYAWICGLEGWRRVFVAFVFGAASASAFAPLEFFPALLIGYAALVGLMDGACAGQQPIRHAAGIGWAFCFGQFLVGWHWIGYAFLVDPTNHLWQMPFALLGLTAGLALYGALALAIAAYFWRPGPARVLIFSIAMASAEWLRGHLLTGFPWNLSAYGWGASLALLQSAALMGSYGLSFLTILLGASLSEPFCRRWRIPLLMTLLFFALWSYGVYRLGTTPSRDVAGVSLRLVQPDIPQAEKYARPLILRNWQRLIDLSLQGAQKNHPPPSHIIWPEAATAFAVARAPGALEEIALFTARGQTLITGSDRVVEGPNRLIAFNSLYLFGPGAGAPTVYDKFHLVPFGEYVPFASLLKRVGISQLTVGEGFQAGDHPHLVKVPGAPSMSPLICYEVIFPGDVTDPNAPRPGWFVNITDDSWFGPWAGPYQHFLTARVRAIEEGLPLARDANTGISAVVDGNGRIRAELGLNRMGVVDSPLPVALPPTPYSRFGDLVFLLFLVTAALVSFGLARR